MRFARAALLLFPSILFCISITAQPPPQRDPRAVAIIAQAMAAMGAGQLSSEADSRASGTLTQHLNRVVTVSVVLKSKGLTKTRVELQHASGHSTRIVNNGRGVVLRPNAPVRRLEPNNTLAARVSYIPVLSLLAECQNPTARVELVSTVEENRTSADVVAVGLGLSSDPVQARMLQAMTRTLFYINRIAGTIERIEYMGESENGKGTRLRVREVLTDYRNVRGVLVPFRRTRYVDGQLESELQLDSLAFNVGVPDAEFELPAGR